MDAWSYLPTERRAPRTDRRIDKSGQKSLAELDAYRYEEAPRRFGINADAIPMTLDDVKILVEWKL